MPIIMFGRTFTRYGRKMVSLTQPESSSIAERLQKATAELRTLEQLIVAGDFSPRILSEFRGAVDSMRQTARVVQTWVGLKQQHRDPYSAISILSEDRVRRTTQMARELTVDLQSLEVDFSTAGLGELFQAITALHERLALLFGVSDRLPGGGG
jgi:hypothetical protein